MALLLFVCSGTYPVYIYIGGVSVLLVRLAAFSVLLSVLCAACRNFAAKIDYGPRPAKGNTIIYNMKNYFELYDLAETFHPSQDAVKAKYYELSRLYHPDRFAAQGTAAMADALAMAAHNNAAYKTLRNPDATMAYILKLHHMLEEEEKYTLPPAFLMEMMELNEAVSDYADMPHNEAARQSAENALNEQLTTWQTATDALTAKYDPNNPDLSLLAQIKDRYMRKKYLLRIHERINTFAAR